MARWEAKVSGSTPPADCPSQGMRPTQGARISDEMASKIFLPPRQTRIDLVGDPAGQVAATGEDALRGQQGMVDTAEAQAYHQDNRQA